MSASFQTDSNFWTKKNVQISSFEVNVKDRIGATKFRPKCDYFTPEKRTDLRKQTNVWNLSFLVIKCMEATSNLREANQDKSGTKMPNTIILSPEMEQNGNPEIAIPVHEKYFPNIPNKSWHSSMQISFSEDSYRLFLHSNRWQIIHSDPSPHANSIRNSLIFTDFQPLKLAPLDAWQGSENIPRDTSHRMPLKKW